MVFSPFRIDIKEGDEVRKERKEAINTINRCLNILELKAKRRAEKIKPELKNEEDKKLSDASSLKEGDVYNLQVGPKLVLWSSLGSLAFFIISKASYEKLSGYL